MAEISAERFDGLRPAAKLSNNPFSPKHLAYSRRWMGLGAGLALAAGGLVARAPAGRRGRRARLLAAWGGLLGGAAAAAGLAGTVDLRIERRSIPLSDLPAGLDGLRIGQLSDMHLGPWYSRRCLAGALAALRRAEPDLIALTGDFVDQVGALPALRRLLAGLSAPLGVWACLGNHDYWSDPGAVARALDGLGVRVLVNGHGVVRRGGAALTVAGVADPWFGAPDLAAALDGAPDAPVLLLAHAPDYADVAGRRIALQLSGHAHAGHINLPLLGPLVVPLMGERYPHGLYRTSAGWLYVSRGLGGLPIRLGAPPEAALLTLRRA